MISSTQQSASIARRLMSNFVERTGVDAEREATRYLWTDAFAVCNAIALGELDVASRLVGQVHHVLGRHRADDEREGWISGLSEGEGVLHPTAGGLRIGKPLPERAPGAPHDPQLEWDRDGQYFHYLTKWVHALRRIAAETGEPRYSQWAAELALAAHEGFTYRDPRGTPRMYWKMSIDLSRPLVPSMGHHDPLDALLTYHEVGLGPTSAPLVDAREMCAGRSWSTDDPLGLGGLLLDAHRAWRLAARRGEEIAALSVELLNDALIGLREFVDARRLERPTEFRLAFRELGLAIGLRAVERLSDAEPPAEGSSEHRRAIDRTLGALRPFLPLAARITQEWLAADKGQERWSAHQDINEIMLVTALLPQGYFGPSDDVEEGHQRSTKEASIND